MPNLEYNINNFAAMLIFIVVIKGPCSVSLQCDSNEYISVILITGKGWQLATHCHLQAACAPVGLSFNHGISSGHLYYTFGAVRHLGCDIGYLTIPCLGDPILSTHLPNLIQTRRSTAELLRFNR